jgi:hypothetical protein
VGIILGLAICGMPVSSGRFGYRWDACELWSVLATCVTLVSLRPLIIVGNLDLWSYLNIV